MAKVRVLVEVSGHQDAAFDRYRMALASEAEAVSQAEAALPKLAVRGLEVVGDFAPVPMFTALGDLAPRALRAASAGGPDSLPFPGPDLGSQSLVAACEIEKSRLRKLSESQGLKVWPDSELTLLGRDDTLHPAPHPFDLARTGGGVDSPVFRPAVALEVIRALLGVEAVWRDGFRGQNIIIGIIDEGVNGAVYPVVGGLSRPNSPQPGSAAVTSHGSMVAAGLLVAAPSAKFYDYPFSGTPRSGGALAMFQEVLARRRLDGTPHLTNNSYGFTGRPSQKDYPHHEVWDSNHPIHRKVREVVASGAPAFFAAGNCGGESPSACCQASGIGPGASIHGSNSLPEVITVAAVNSFCERLGYSSQGPGGFADQKPDIAAYSHYFGNFGPGRPGGSTHSAYDNGTSAAAPIAAGVAALLLSVYPGLTPDDLKTVLTEGAIDLGPPGPDFDTGHGVINAAASYAILKYKISPATLTTPPLPQPDARPALARGVPAGPAAPRRNKPRKR